MRKSLVLYSVYMTKSLHKLVLSCIAQCCLMSLFIFQKLTLYGDSTRSQMLVHAIESISYFMALYNNYDLLQLILVKTFQSYIFLKIVDAQYIHHIALVLVDLFKVASP